MREYRTALFLYSESPCASSPVTLLLCYHITSPPCPTETPTRPSEIILSPTLFAHASTLCTCYPLPAEHEPRAQLLPTPPLLQHHLHWWSPALSASSRAGGHMWTTAEPWYPFGQIPCLPTPTRPRVPRGAHRSQLDLIWPHNYRGTGTKGQRGPVQVPWSIIQPTFQTLIVKTSNHLERGTRKKIKGNCTRKQTTFLLFLNQILKTYFIQIRFEKKSQNIKFLHNLSSI